MTNIRKLNEEIERILEETEESVGGLRLVPHGENSVKYYDKALEYLKNHAERVKAGFINISLTDLGINSKGTIGYELIN